MLTAEGKEHATTHVVKVDTMLSPRPGVTQEGSLPAEDGSHSTDQPCGIEVGRAELSVVFLKLIPENDTSKTEYSNTQQGLPKIGYMLARN
jgi:hypothetical protein